MKQEKLTPSGILQLFLGFVDTAKTDYQYHLEAMKNEERITQDYPHATYER